MWQTNLKVVTVVLVTVGLYTGVANWIPQVQSEPPEELSFTGDVSPEELVAAGQELFLGAGGCSACHGSGTRAPNLRTSEDDLGPIGARCGDRVSGQDCKAYLHASLTDPTAHVVEGYGAIMPDASRTLSPAQIWSLVAYLQSMGGEVTVTGDDIEAEPATGSDDGSAGSSSPLLAGGSTDPMAVLEAGTCLACHTLGDQGGPIGPSFDDIGSRRDADHIRRSILVPSADTTEGYEAVAGTMPANFGEQMSAAQLEAVVRFLASQEGG